MSTKLRLPVLSAPNLEKIALVLASGCCVAQGSQAVWSAQGESLMSLPELLHLLQPRGHFLWSAGAGLGEENTSERGVCLLGGARGVTRRFYK